MSAREKNYDYLRSISCFAIVLLHVSSSYWSVVSRESTDFIVMTVYNAITRFAVPVFMMLSGAFLLEQNKASTVRDSLKRFGKSVFTFYIWSAFYAFQGIAVKFITGREVTAELWSASLERFLWGHYHMWFVFLIMGFYLLLPIVKKICESKNVTEYFLVLWVVTRFVIPVIAPILHMGWVDVWIGRLSLNMLIGYLGYFVLGYYIRKYGFAKKVRMVVYAGGVVGVLYGIFGTIVQSRAQDAYVETFFGAGSWNVLLFATAVFTFFANVKAEAVCNSFVGKIAGCSFIIYMIHPFFLEKLNLVGITTVSFYCLFSIPILTVGIFLCSYLVAAIIKRVVQR